MFKALSQLILRIVSLPIRFIKYIFMTVFESVVQTAVFFAFVIGILYLLADYFNFL